MSRPVDFECPWCGPNGVPVDFSLPMALRLCDECNEAQLRPPAPPPPDPEKEHRISQLRHILADHVTEVNSKPWPGCEHGKAIIGNAILGALEELGCDRKAELERAAPVAEMSGYERQKRAEAVLAARKEKP